MKIDALEVFLTEVLCGSKHKENGESGVQSKTCQWVEIMLIRSAVAIHPRLFSHGLERIIKIDWQT